MSDYCEDCRVPVDTSETYCPECLEGRRKITQLIIQDPARKAMSQEQAALNQAHAMLGGLYCHKCGRTCGLSKESEQWLSRDTCPVCTEKLMDDSRVQNASRRLGGKRGDGEE